MQVSLIKLLRDSKHDGLNTGKTYRSLSEIKWRAQLHEWLTVVKYHFRSGTVEHCLPLSLCLYSAVTKAECRLCTLWGLFTLFSLLSNRTHVSSSSLPLSPSVSIPRGYRRSCCFTFNPSPLPRPAPSFPGSSAHGNNTDGSELLCTPVSSPWKRDGWACAGWD